MTPEKKWTPWTMKRARAVWEQLRSGVDVATIAAENNCTVRNIHRRLKCAGFDPEAARRADTSHDMQNERIYTLRKAGKTYQEIAADLGMEPSAQTMRTLYMRLSRYCERIEIPYPVVVRPRQPRVYAPPTMRDDIIDAIVAALRTAEAQGEALRPEDLPARTKLPEHAIKAHIGEARRRGLVADGIVPAMNEALHEARARTGAEAFVLMTCVQAWLSGAELPTLETLTAADQFSRSFLNATIVKLRREGLLRPRGFLYLRATE
jgi:hypothetical protein